jgi:hypothetical protein
LICNSKITMGNAKEDFKEGKISFGIDMLS